MTGITPIRSVSSKPISGLASGSEPPHDGVMEARIDRLDRAVERIDSDLTTIKVSVARIEERMTHIPTNADLLKVVSSAQWKIISAIGAFAVVAILKWAWPHLFP